MKTFCLKSKKELPDLFNTVEEEIPGSTFGKTIDEGADLPNRSNKCEDPAKPKVCRRLVWKKKSLDPNTKKIYEHLLEARKELDNYKTKNKRYVCLMGSAQPFLFYSKYTK